MTRLIRFVLYVEYLLDKGFPWTMPLCVAWFAFCWPVYVILRDPMDYWRRKGPPF
jgi:hypothetical protein